MRQKESRSPIDALDFHEIDYLKEGTASQRKAWEIIQEHRLFELLQDFHPLLAGTIPLRIDIEGSDLDILCQWRDPDEFEEQLTADFRSFEKFNLERKTINGKLSILCRFEIDTFPVEIFGQNRVTTSQEAWRHMIHEHDLLERYGEALRWEVIRLKKKGYKTEPAFAKALGWDGDPYKMMLELKPDQVE